MINPFNFPFFVFTKPSLLSSFPGDLQSSKVGAETRWSDQRGNNVSSNQILDKTPVLEPPLAMSTMRESIDWLFALKMPLHFLCTYWTVWLDRSQSDFYFVPQEIQTDTATPLSMEIFGRIDFSLGRLITRVTKTPKPTKQHVTWAVELVRIFFHSLLWPWEPLSWRSLWNCSVGGHDFPPIWVHDFSLPIASSTQPKGSTMPSYYYAYKNTESRLNWNSFNPWRCFYMDVVYTKTNVKTETQAKTSTKRFKDPMYALFLKISGFRDIKYDI